MPEKSSSPPAPVRNSSSSDQLSIEAALTPSAIVRELDKHIIGQKDAKRSVAIALRNRYRRRRVRGEMQNEIYPKNILMIGNTGVGKTEIARRLAHLVQAPFIKVEATKFSQVGYVGRDVESIIRDLMHHAVTSERAKQLKVLEASAAAEVTERLLDALLPESAAAAKRAPVPATNAVQAPLDTLSLSVALPHTPGIAAHGAATESTSQAQTEQYLTTRAKLKQRLLAGDFENKVITLALSAPAANTPAAGINISGQNLGDQQMDALHGLMKNFNNMFRPKQTKQRMAISAARPLLLQQVTHELLDMNQVISTAKQRTETLGIVFVDEVDKIVTKGTEQRGNLDISREGVQRDLLPLVEGCNVATPNGNIATDHILFIAAGAFHTTSPADMIPEMQGRFPIRVKLSPLKAPELQAILVQPKSALSKQYQALLATEGINLELTTAAIAAIAKMAERVNNESENIGARRLATLMEKLLEELLFHGKAFIKSKRGSALQAAAAKSQDTQTQQRVVIDEAYVTERFRTLLPSKDLQRYIL